MSSPSSDFDSDEDFSDDSDLDISEGAGVAKISAGVQSNKQPEPKPSEVPVKVEPIITEKTEDIKIVLLSNQKRPKLKQANTRRSLSLSRIPLLNKETTNQDTYDIEKLLNPKVQKAAFKTLGLEKQISLPKSQNLNLENEEKAAPKPTDVANRLLENWEKVKAKKLANRAQSDQKEMDQCPFKPKINTDTKNRSHEEFYEDMKKYLDEKLKKIKNKQDENEMLIRTKSQELPFRPSLCVNSLRIESMKAENTMPRHERLYQLHKSKDNQGLQSILRDKSFASTQMTQSTDDSQVLFHPAVNKRSKELVREGSVENILYQDALRRHHKSVDTPTSHVPAKVICSNSEKVLIEKFKNDFEDEWNLVDIDDTNIVTYSRMLEILRSMYFLSNNKKQEEARLLTLEIWKILESSGKPVNKDSLVVALIAVMGFYQDWMNDKEKYPNRLCLSEEQAKKLHFRNSLLYENRLSITNKSTINKTYRESYDFSFKPQICAMSERLVTSSSVDKKPRNSDSLAVELYRERVKLQEKQAALKQKFSELELKDCTFAPRVKELPKSYQQAKTTEKETLSKDYKNIISCAPTKVERTAVLFSLASLEKNRKEDNHKPYEEQEIEKNKAELTFKPKLYPRENFEEGKEAHGGIHETVERIVKARRDREIVKALREKGWTRSPDTRQVEEKQETRRNPLPRPPQKNPDKSVKDKEAKKIPKEEKPKKIPIKKPALKPQNKLPVPKAKEEKPKPVAKPLESLENSKGSIDSHNSISTASSEVHPENLNNSGSSLENGKFTSNEVIYEDEEMESSSEEGDFHQESTEKQDQEGVENEENSEEYSDEEENEFNIEINLGNGKTEYLTIVKGIDVEEIVKEFAAKHGIAGEAEEKILQLVKSLPSE